MLRLMCMKRLAYTLLLLPLLAGCSNDSLAQADAAGASPSAVAITKTKSGSGDRWWVRTRPDPQDRTLDLMVREKACASRQPATDRVRPVVDYNPDSIVVTITVAYAGGVQSCPGNPDSPYTLELAEPVGDRVIKDGRNSPPKAAQITYPR